MNNTVMLDSACNIARTVFVPYNNITSEQIDDICAIIRGEKVAVKKGEDYEPIEPPMSVADAVKLTGLSAQDLHYHARRGRIRKAMIPGANRAIGFIAADIKSIVRGR